MITVVNKIVTRPSDHFVIGHPVLDPLPCYVGTVTPNDGFCYHATLDRLPWRMLVPRPAVAWSAKRADWAIFEAKLCALVPDLRRYVGECEDVDAAAERQSDVLYNLGVECFGVEERPARTRREVLDEQAARGKVSRLVSELREAKRRARAAFRSQRAACNRCERLVARWRWHDSTVLKERCESNVSRLFAIAYRQTEAPCGPSQRHRYSQDGC
eukprot:COSAG02_NODE_2128_length_9740_cov_20.436833_5_plen_214_part_00